MNIENPEQLLVKLGFILEKLRIRYFVTGGFAVSVWGRPRATFDIDVVIYLVEPDVDALAQALRKISEAGYIDEETAEQAAKKGKGSFNFIDGVTGLKVDFFVMRDDAFTASQFKRRKIKTIDGQKIFFISPEDLIVSKLLWHAQSGSSLQLDDVRSILKISGAHLDMRYLKQWSKHMGVLATLDEALKSSKTA